MGVHEGHRERLKQRYLEHGLDNFNEVNALELMLFYAVPRKDTNEIAHALIAHFGSLQGILDASVDELCQVEGVGRHMAVLISLITQLNRKAAIGQADKGGSLRNATAAGKYLVPRFMGEKVEVLYLLCLDSQKRVLCCKEISRGVVNTVDVNIRKIVEAALKQNASSVILSHNHPDSIALPSVEDDMITKQVLAALRLVNIPLVDHIIVSGDDFVSYADSGLLR